LDKVSDDSRDSNGIFMEIYLMVKNILRQKRLLKRL